MKKFKLVLRRATQRDVEALSPWDENPSVKAICAEIDGEIIGLGGVMYVKGRWLAFYSATEKLRPYKIAVGRAAVRFFRQMRQDGVKFIYADRDLNEPTSGRWLQSLGFEVDPKSRYFYRWSAR